MFIPIKIEDFMLSCVNKKYFGFECPGCGIQRAAVFLLKGEFTAAFYMYPAIYPLILLFGFLFFNTFFKIKFANKIIILLSIISVTTIIGNYILKLTNNH